MRSGRIERRSRRRPGAARLPLTSPPCSRPARRTASPSCRSEAGPASSAASRRCAGSLRTARLARSDRAADGRRRSGLDDRAARPRAPRARRRRRRSTRRASRSATSRSRYRYATIGGFAATRSAGQASSGYGRFDAVATEIELTSPTGDDAHAGDAAHRRGAVPAGARARLGGDLRRHHRRRASGSGRCRSGGATRAGSRRASPTGSRSPAASRRTGRCPTSSGSPTATRPGSRWRCRGWRGRSGAGSTPTCGCEAGRTAAC